MIYFACNLRKQPSADSKIKPRSCNVERHIDDSKVKEKRKRKQNILKKIFFRPPTPNLIDVGKHIFLVEGGYMSALPKSSCLMADSERPYFFDEFDVLLTGTAE